MLGNIISIVKNKKFLLVGTSAVLLLFGVLTKNPKM